MPTKPRKRKTRGGGHGGLTPISQLSPSQRRERQTARKAGFKDEYAYRRWLARNAEYGPADYKKLDRSLRGDARIDRIREIRRAERRERETRPAREILRKYQVLVIDDDWSHLAFWQRYRIEINHIIDTTGPSTVDNRFMRRLRRELFANFLIQDYSEVT